MRSLAETITNIRQNEIKRIAQDMAAACCCVKMISLEKAQELKEAGYSKPVEEGFYFAPSLSQLLAEIEERGWNWTIRKLNTYISTPEYTYRLVLLDKNESTWGIKNRQFMSSTLEDAAADALLCILRQVSS